MIVSVRIDAILTDQKGGKRTITTLSHPIVVNVAPLEGWNAFMNILADIKFIILGLFLPILTALGIRNVRARKRASYFPARDADRATINNSQHALHTNHQQAPVANSLKRAAIAKYQPLGSKGRTTTEKSGEE